MVRSFKCDKNNVKAVINIFWKEYMRRWIRAHRRDDIFYKNNKKWLEEGLVFRKHGGCRRGRPSKALDEISPRSIRHRTQSLRDNYTTDELLYATQMSLRCAGRIAEANVLKDILQVKTCIYKIYTSVCV